MSALLQACKAMAKGWVGARVRQRRDGAVAVVSDRFTGMVRRTKRGVTIQHEGRERTVKVEGSLTDSLAKAVDTAPLTRGQAIGIVTDAIRRQAIKGLSPQGYEFSAWQDDRFRAKGPGGIFSSRVARETAAWLVDDVGRKAAVAATGRQEVTAAPPPWVDTKLQAMESLARAPDPWSRDIQNAVKRLRSNLRKNAPQLKNLEYAFKQLQHIGRAGVGRTEKFRKALEKEGLV